MTKAYRHSLAGGRIVVGVAWAFSAWGVSFAAAAESKSAINVYHETVAERKARLEKEAGAAVVPAPEYLKSMDAARAANSRARLRELEQSGIRTYVGKDGTPLFTNRSNQQNRKDLTEIRLSYEPINVPKKYKKVSIESYGSKDINELVKVYCKKYRLDEKLVLALIQAESGFNVRAKSPKGASGLMQLMPGTAKDMGVTNIFDPAQNIAGGTQYLAKMLEMFKGDVQLALAAYNAGPGAVQKYGGIPPYDETRNYVKKVVADYTALSNGKIKLASGGASKYRDTPRQNAAHYTVHFKSGLVQPASQVRDREDGWYELQWGDKAWPVKKDLVKEIVAPS